MWGREGAVRFLYDLAWWFEWAAGRFYELADNSSWRPLPYLPWDFRPFGWLEPHLRGLAIFGWTARDKIRGFADWLNNWLADRWLDWYYLPGNIEIAVDKLVKLAKETILKAARELWEAAIASVKSFAEGVNTAFNAWKRGLEDGFFKDVSGWINYVKEDLPRELGEWWKKVEKTIGDIAALNPYRSLWDSLQAVKDRITFTFTTGWDKLSAFLADPPGTIWAWLEPILLDRVEQFLNERWDTPR